MSFLFTAADVTNYGGSGSPMSANQTYTFHRLFGDINGDGTVNSVDQGALTQAFRGYDPAFGYNANGAMDSTDLGAFRRDPERVFQQNRESGIDPEQRPVDAAVRLQRRRLIELGYSADDVRWIRSDNTDVYPNVP